MPTPNKTISIDGITHREYPLELKQSVLPVMLGVKETAANFGIAQHHARQLALTGKVKATRAGNKILINQQSVSDYFNNCTLGEPEVQIGSITPISVKL